MVRAGDKVHKVEETDMCDRSVSQLQVHTFCAPQGLLTSL